MSLNRFFIVDFCLGTTVFTSSLSNHEEQAKQMRRITKLARSIIPKRLLDSFLAVQDSVADDDIDTFDSDQPLRSNQSPYSAMSIVDFSNGPPDLPRNQTLDDFDRNGGFTGLDSNVRTPGAGSATISSVTNDDSDLTLTRKIRELEEQVAKFTKRKTSNVRVSGKRPTLNGQDRANHISVVPQVHKLFHEIKWLPDGWEFYSVDDNSVCQKLMRVVSVPHGLTSEHYYQDTIVPFAVMKWRTLKNNFGNCVKKYYEGDGESFLSFCL